jgi:hypothetical protein
MRNTADVTAVKFIVVWSQCQSFSLLIHLWKKVSDDLLFVCTVVNICINLGIISYSKVAFIFSYSKIKSTVYTTISTLFLAWVTYFETLKPSVRSGLYFSVIQVMLDSKSTLALKIAFCSLGKQSTITNLVHLSIIILL